MSTIVYALGIAIILFALLWFGFSSLVFITDIWRHK